LEATVLSTLVIYITAISLEQSICQLETLASQKSRAAQFAQTLKIKYLLPSFPPSISTNLKNARFSQKNDRLQVDAQAMIATMERCLGLAISSMHNLKSVV
jgi:hypothetical protein